jgi:GGDEF domain-containing protein
VLICGHPVRVDAGIGTYLTVQTDTADRSLQAADQALYAAAHPTQPDRTTTPA